MDFQNDNGAASANAGRALGGVFGFLQNWQQLQKDNAYRQANLGLATQANTRAQQASGREQQLFDSAGFPLAKNQLSTSDLDLQMAKNRMGVYNRWFGGSGGTPGAPASTFGQPQDAAGSGLFGPSGPSINLGPAVTQPGATPTGEAGPTPGGGAPAPTLPLVSPSRQTQLFPDKTGMPEVQEYTAPLTPSEKALIDQNPDQVQTLLPPHRWPVAETYLKTNASSIANKKATTEAAINDRTLNQGTPEQQQREVDLTGGAADAARLLARLDEVVHKFGNYESSGTLPALLGSNQAAAGDLHSLPVQISDALNKVINPGMGLREGQVEMQKKYNIPMPGSFWTALGTTSAATRKGIANIRDVLVSRIKSYEDAMSSHAPIQGLTPEIRAMVGDTRLSQEWQKAHGSPVPTTAFMSQYPTTADSKWADLPGETALPAVGRPASVSAPASGDTAGAVMVKSQAGYDVLKPGTRYIDSTGVMKVKQGKPTVSVAPSVQRPSTKFVSGWSVKGN
jgi:hypothetical protein